MTKPSVTPIATPQETSAASSPPVMSMLMGVVSITTFMWFLGIPAVIFGIIGLCNHSRNRGYSVTGIVTGLISTFLLIFAAAIIVAMILISFLRSDDSTYLYDDYPEEGYSEGA